MTGRRSPAVGLAGEREHARRRLGVAPLARLLTTGSRRTAVPSPRPACPRTPGRAIYLACGPPRGAARALTRGTRVRLHAPQPLVDRRLGRVCDRGHHDIRGKDAIHLRIRLANVRRRGRRRPRGGSVRLALLPTRAPRRGVAHKRDRLHGRVCEGTPVVEMAPPSMLDPVVHGRASGATPWRPRACSRSSRRPMAGERRPVTGARASSRQRRLSPHGPVDPRRGSGLRATACPARRHLRGTRGCPGCRKRVWPG